VPAIGRHQFTQRNRAAIAQLARPVAELVAAIVGRPRLHAGVQRVAAEYLGEAIILHVGRLEAEQRSYVRRPGQQGRRGDRRRHHR